jgi:hypothetical protein
MVEEVERRMEISFWSSPDNRRWWNRQTTVLKSGSGWS